MRKAVHSLILLVFLITSSISPAFAATPVICAKAQSDDGQLILSDRVVRSSRDQTVDLTVDENRNPLETERGGVARIEEGALSEKVKTGLMELLGLTTETHSETIRTKDLEKGFFVVALSLEKNYSVEVTYELDNRPGLEKHYFARRAKLILPNGHPADITGNPLDLDGNWRKNFKIDLTPYDGVSDHDYTLFLPSMISGPVIDLFKKSVPSIESYITKKELIALTAKNDYYKMRALILWRSTLDFLGRYQLKAFPKAIARMTVRPVLMGAALFMALTFAPGAVRGVMNQVHYLQEKVARSWVDQSMEKYQQSDRISPDVKAQLKNLQVEFDASLTRENLLSQADHPQAADLNATDKFELDPQQYMWASTTVDAKTHKELTLIFMTQQNKSGISVISIAVDPQKYATLLSFLKNRGLFMPAFQLGSNP